MGDGGPLEGLWAAHYDANTERDGEERTERERATRVDPRIRRVIGVCGFGDKQGEPTGRASVNGALLGRGTLAAKSASLLYGLSSRRSTAQVTPDS